MEFNELLAIASSGNTSMKLGLLESWVKIYANTLIELIDIRRLEIDMTNPNCSKQAPAWMMIKQGHLHSSIISLQTISEDIRKFDEREASRYAEMNSKTDDLQEINTDDIPFSNSDELIDSIEIWKSTKELYREKHPDLFKNDTSVREDGLTNKKLINELLKSQQQMFTNLDT